MGEALTGANFVIVSILPGTFDEMEFDAQKLEKQHWIFALGLFMLQIVEVRL